MFGFGKDGATSQPKTALEQAHEPPKKQGFLGGQATKMIENLLDTGIDGKGRFLSASAIAERALAESGGDVEKAIDAVRSSHLKLASAGGFLTSLGGFVTLPVALPANVAGFYVLATRMTAATAQLRGHDLADQRIRTAVLLTLVGAEADDLLAKAGMVAPTGRLTNLAAQRLPGPALMVVNKAIGFRILTSAGKKTFSRFGRNVPLVGGVVGAGMDFWLLRQIFENAVQEFPPASAQPSAQDGK